MNQIAEQKTPINSVSILSGLSGTKIAPQNLGEVVKFAELMSRADIALPKHLRGNAGACMAVALQALEWGMSPFAVASKSYQVNGAIAYEAQLIAAVVNTRSGIKGRLKYTYKGEGGALQCTVTGTLDGEEFSYTSPRMDQITTKNSPLWKTDPQQQLGYYSARSWARRYTPEVILGVYDRDEAQSFQGPDNARDVTPSIVGRLKAAQEATQEPQDGREGFSDGFAYTETETMSGNTYDPDTGEIEDQEIAADASPVDAAPVGEADAPNEASPAPTPKPDKQLLIKTFRLLWAAKGPDPDVVDAQAATLKDDYADANDITKKKAGTIKTQIKMVPEIGEADVLEYLAGVIGVEPHELTNPE
jgi:hypothetical protein